MKAGPMTRWRTWTVAALGGVALTTACSSSDGASIPDQGGGNAAAGDASVATGGDGGAAIPADAGATPPPPPPAACSLPAVNGASPFNATFKNLAPPTVAPATMTGGNPSGRWKMVKATSYLPKESAALVDPTKASGTVVGWVVFQGSSYRQRLALDFTVPTPLGNQVQKTDVDSQGTFAVQNEKVVFTPSCDAPGPTADAPVYTFTAGSGTLKIVIKSKVAQLNADTFLEIEATPE